MSTQTQIDRITAAKAAIAEEIVKKGVAVPAGTTLDGFAALVADIMLSINTDTETTISGLLKGNGSKVEAATAGSDYSLPVRASTVTLTTSGWSSSKTQQVTVSGVLADATKQVINVAPAPGSGKAYSSAGIECTAQSANSLTFTCDTIPSNNIVVNIAIHTAGG